MRHQEIFANGYVSRNDLREQMHLHVLDLAS